MPTTKQSLLDLILNDELNQALENMLEEAVEGKYRKEDYNHLIQLKAQLNKIKKEQGLGLMKIDDFHLQLNRIRFEVTEFVTAFFDEEGYINAQRLAPEQVPQKTESTAIQPKTPQVIPLNNTVKVKVVYPGRKAFSGFKVLSKIEGKIDVFLDDEFICQGGYVTGFEFEKELTPGIHELRTKDIAMSWKTEFQTTKADNQVVWLKYSQLKGVIFDRIEKK